MSISNSMKTAALVFIATLATMLLPASMSVAASDEALPVPGYAAAAEPQGVHEVPDPKMTYKAVFDVGTGPESLDKINPMLEGLAKYLNTLAKYGVPPEHRVLAVVFHQKGTPAILTDAAFAARNGGHHNPNIELIRNLKKAGVDFRVCGQAVIGAKIKPEEIQPEIQVDLWALTTLVDFQLRGYVKVGGG